MTHNFYSEGTDSIFQYNTPLYPLIKQVNIDCM